MPNPIINNLSEISDRYDCFLVDLWGVIYDGYKPYPGAIDCLYALKRQGKKVAIAANWSRRSSAIAQLMANDGIPKDSYDFMATAGEMTHIALRDRTDEQLKKLGNRCFLLCGKGYSPDIAEGLSLDLVPTPAKADFALCIGPNDKEKDISSWENILLDCLNANLLMLCANPDISAKRGNIIELTTGALTTRYTELGGKVKNFGKPMPEFFHDIIKLMNDTPSRSVMIGDGMLTDIKGANAAQIDSIFITGGLSLNDLGGEWGKPPTPNTLNKFISKNNYNPTYTLPALRW